MINIENRKQYVRLKQSIKINLLSNYGLFFNKTDTSSLASRENKNRFGGFPNKIQNNTIFENASNQTSNIAETPLVRLKM